MASKNERDFYITLKKITCSAAVLITTLPAMSSVGEFSPSLKVFYFWDLYMYNFWLYLCKGFFLLNKEVYELIVFYHALLDDKSFQNKKKLKK